MTPEEYASDVPLPGFNYDSALAMWACIAEKIRAAVAEEREECAGAEMPSRPPGYADRDWQVFEAGWLACAAAIRARGGQ